MRVDGGRKPSYVRMNATASERRVGLSKQSFLGNDGYS